MSRIEPYQRTIGNSTRWKTVSGLIGGHIAVLRAVCTAEWTDIWWMNGQRRWHARQHGQAFISMSTSTQAGSEPPQRNCRPRAATHSLPTERVRSHSQPDEHKVTDHDINSDTVDQNATVHTALLPRSGGAGHARDFHRVRPRPVAILLFRHALAHCYA